MRAFAAVRVLAAASLLLSAPAQDTGFAEVRRWKWMAPKVVCGAADAEGTVAALGMRNERDDGWVVMLYDPETRAELRRLPVARRPGEVRFPDAQHVEVTVPDTDSFFSLARWHRYRIADGTLVGEPVLDRIADDDPAARAVFRGTREPGPSPCVFVRYDSVWWWKNGARHAIADYTMDAVELTPDGRFVAVWSPSQVVVVPVAGGEPRRLPIHGEDVRAIDAGGNGDELVVVTKDAVTIWRAGAARELRRLPFAAEHVVDAAVAPGGGVVALAFEEHERVVLVDTGSDRVTATEVHAARIAWTGDGSALVGANRRLLHFLDRDGKTLGEASAGHLDVKFLRVDGMTHHLVALDQDTASWGRFAHSDLVTRGMVASPLAPPSLPFALCGDLPPDQLVATSDGSVLVVDAKSHRPLHEVAIGARVVRGVGIARAARRVAAVAGEEIVVFDVAPPK